MAPGNWDNADYVARGSQSIFVDRRSESEALAAALLMHRARIDTDVPSTQENRNVLVFYGDGGVGKSELSARLEAWLRAKPSDASSHDWGAPPRCSVDALVRWDLNNSYGTLDVVEVLALLRTELGRFRRSWPAFDLAFADFFRVMRPGMDLRLRAPGGAQTSLSEVIAALFGDAASATGFAVSGGLGAGGFAIIRRLISGKVTAARASRVCSEYPQIKHIIRSCEDLPGPPDRVAEVASQIAFLLSDEIHREPFERRPLVVVFVDHMERIQVSSRNHVGESTLNMLVSRLPYFLFVVTGRNSLGWYRPDATHLPVRGAIKWPLLDPTSPPEEEPHQHLIGNLATPDAQRLLRAAFDRGGIRVQPQLVEQLAEMTGGWPLHLDTLIAVAQERADPMRDLTASDLDGPMPLLVDRLLNDLPSDEEEAFRSACLLSYFDPPLVAAAGEVTRGAVERLTKRTIVRPNPQSSYPFRVHETLRRLVREGSSAAEGGWADDDWLARATRALAEAKRRFDAALVSHSDEDAVASLALGLNVAAENGASASWLVPGIRVSPSISHLENYIPSDSPARATPDMQDILAFVRLRSRATGHDDVTDELLELTNHRSSISSTAGLWRVYDLRLQGRIEEAIAQLNGLITDFGDRPGLYKYQHVITLQQSRRFREACALSTNLTPAQQDRLKSMNDRSHGRLVGMSDPLRAFADQQNSRRYQLECLATWLSVRHREVGVSRQVATELYEQADAVGHNTAKAQAAGVLGEMAIFDDSEYRIRVEELEALSGRRNRPYVRWSMLLAMRALACGEAQQARLAQTIGSSVSYRSSSYIPVEVLLEHLGFPLPPQDTQWLEPYDIVRTRWLTILQAVVERARVDSL